MKGFTLIEIIIAIGIFIILAVVTVPMAFRFLGVQNLDTTSNSVMAHLRQVQTQALFQKNDSSFGIRFATTSYTIFQGSSYATRTTSQDIVITLPTGVSISGITEIVFAKRTGLPNATGTLLIQRGSDSRSVQINQQGLVEKI